MPYKANSVFDLREKGRDVLKHSSARPSHVKIQKDEFMIESDRPSDDYEFLFIQFTYQFRTGIF